jgi:VIT1/CCC1 family predicted Fe2+/Mn2+ transporter
LAQVHFDLGDHEEALDLVRQALHVHRETGHRLGEARSLVESLGRFRAVW